MTTPPLVSKSIRINFTPDELNAMGKQLAEIGFKKTNLQDEKKQAAKEFDGKIAELESEESRLRRLRIDEYHYQTRDCVLEYDLTTNRKLYFLPDTMELVAEDPIGPNEQIPLAAAGERGESPTFGLLASEVGTLRAIAERHAKNLMRLTLDERREPTMRERANLTSEALKEAGIDQEKAAPASRFYTSEVARFIEAKFDEFEAMKGSDKPKARRRNSSASAEA